jgi:PAS domain S-box-containing protein
MAANLLTKHPAAASLTLYATCLFAAWTTELLSAVPGAGLSIWLPAGFLLAAASTTPYRKWPLWALASGCAEATGNLLWYGHEWGPAAMLIAGNITAGLTGAWLVKRTIGQDFMLASVRNTLQFLVIAILIVPPLSATIGSVALGLSYDNPPFAAWQRILLGDATGAVVAAPLGLLIFGAAAPLPRMIPARWAEATLLAVIFLAMGALSLGGFLPLAFLMISPMLWAALRFRTVGAIASIVALTALAAFFTAADLSPFAERAVYGLYGAQGLQLFVIVAATTALLLAAIAEENRGAVRALHQSNRTREDRVAERSASLELSEARARETANLLTAIGEACPDLIFAKDRNLDIIYANAATLATLGIDDPALLVGQSEREFYAAVEDHDAVRRNDLAVLEKGETVIAEEVVTDSAGSRRVFRSTKAPLFDGEGRIAGLAGVSVDITDIKQSEWREKMLVREVEHRARNLLAVVQGLVHLTDAPTVKEFKTAIAKRIRALARTNGAIAASRWEGANLRSIIDEELAPYIDETGARIRISGEDVVIDPATAQSVTLVLHELTTNAAKYGALSADSGRLEVRWTVSTSPEQHIDLQWAESGMDAVSPPSRTGFGSTVIMAFGEDRPGSSVDMSWKPEGLRVAMRIPLNRNAKRAAWEETPDAISTGEAA